MSEMIVIVPDTPENLIESMDDYVREYSKLSWWQFSEKRFLAKWILRAYQKRVKLLEERTQ